MLRSPLILVLFLSCPAICADPGAAAYVLQLPDSVKTVLIAETSTATLHRFDASEDGLVAAATQRMSIGENGVGKMKTGDRRTPLGIYFIVEELATTNLHEKYGPVAFPLDYPNAWDEINDRTGYGIWIHGVTPGAGLRPERDTDGCIALPNDQLLLLKPHIAPLKTPVIVTRAIRTEGATEAGATREQLMSAIRSWADSYRDGNWSRYLSWYAQDFSYRGMSRAEWTAYRLQTVGNRPLDDFQIDEIMLLADPDADLYLSRFRQQITEPDGSITTIKRLYWRKSADGEFQIVAEDNG